MSILVFGVIFLAIASVLVVFLLVILTGLLQWRRNNRAPLLTVPAIVLAKRQETRGGANNSSVSTDYFVAFEVQGGQRIELPVDGSEFGVLVERDRGLLSHQGTRFKGFARAPQDL